MRFRSLALIGTLSAFSVFAVMAVPALTQSEVSSSADPQTDIDFDLTYEKFTLENGLDVILHVDRSDPIVAFSTVVHVGSNREKPGRTGFAHFFEHMAFNDSENVPRGWNRKAIPDWGGQRNGGTWNDGTIYFEVVPKDAFDKILWIDSDRLGYMINTVTQDALEREKQVVKNEKRQRVDNAPYGYTGEVIRKALYPKDHPYNWTVIGALPDLQAATLDDLREFYNQYYGAGNVTLSIVGDIDIEETKAKVKRWFGEIRRGPDVKPLAPRPVTLTADKSLYFEDNFAKLPELRMTLPTVEAYHPDHTALNVLAQILAGSKSAPVYKSIVNYYKLAPSAFAFNNSSEIAGEFVFVARAKSGIDLNEVKLAIKDGLKRFEKDGVSGVDLARIKAEQETDLYNTISTALGKANQMARDNEFAGHPAQILKTAEEIKALTADDIMRVYETYVKDKPAIITSFVPKGQAELAVEGAELATVWLEEVKAGVANEEVGQGAEAVYDKTPSRYDRSEPPFGDLPLVKTPPIWEGQLKSDVSVYGIESSEIPLVNFDITFTGGAWTDGKAKRGAADLLARIMNQGSTKRSPEEMEQAIGLLGSSINVNNGREDFTISATSLSRNFEATVELVAEIFTKPRFKRGVIEQARSAALTTIKGREANPNAIAGQAFNKLTYGDNHPYGYTVDGSQKTVSGLKSSDIKRAYRRLLDHGVRIHIAGDIDQARAIKAFDAAFGNTLKSKNKPTKRYDVPEQGNASKVFFIDVPGSKQSVINMGKIVASSLHKDATRIDYTNEKLGGGISGDLAQTLRIEKGYTYGAFSGIGRGLAPQTFRASTSVRANATGASLEIIRDMIGNYGENYDQAAVELTQQKLIKEDTRASESLGAKRGILREMTKYGKAETFMEDEQTELLSMSLPDFKRIAEEYLKEPDMTYVIVGDKQTQWEAVKTFAGGDLTELDIFGNPVRP